MTDTHAPQSSVMVGLKSCCPRCGQGKLFTGFLTVAPSCSACDLDYSFAEAGDGPAVFIMMIAGFVIAGLALYVEVKYQPPYWVHALLWGPLTLIMTLGLLRPLKGWLIAQQYKHNAREHRTTDDGN
ncbi:MAG: DUF983 domain-containing protein [Pseudomonadota bacterium]